MKETAGTVRRYLLIAVVLALASFLVGFVVRHSMRGTLLNFDGQFIELPRKYTLDLNPDLGYYRWYASGALINVGSRRRNDITDILGHFANGNAKRLNCRREALRLRDPVDQLIIYDKEVYFYLSGGSADLYDEVVTMLCKE